MKDSYERALAWVLDHEGGYVNHPDDPGGATNRGVTQAVYDATRRRAGQETQSVRHITDDEVAAIYRVQYWDAVRGDDLPAGVDYAVFDFAVNSGPRRAAEFLQRVLGVEVDGIIGNVTLSAARDADAAAVVKALCANRLAWLKRLRHWPTFGRGWSRRVEHVRARGVSMANADPEPPRAGIDMPHETVDQVPPPDPVPSAKAQAKDNAGGLTAAVGGAAGAVGTVAAAANDAPAPIQYALAVVIVLGVAFLLAHAWRSDA